MDRGAEADDAPAVFLAAPPGCSLGLGCSRIHQEQQLGGATDASYKVQQGKESHLHISWCWPPAALPAKWQEGGAEGSWGCGYGGWIISIYPTQPIIC